MFILKRTLPDGTEKQSSQDKTKRQAAVRASYVLHDNANVPKADAQKFSAQLNKLPLGETLEHDSGYKFEIEKVN